MSRLSIFYIRQVLNCCLQNCVHNACIRQQNQRLVYSFYKSLDYHTVNTLRGYPSIPPYPFFVSNLNRMPYPAHCWEITFAPCTLCTHQGSTAHWVFLSSSDGHTFLPLANSHLQQRPVSVRYPDEPVLITMKGSPYAGLILIKDLRQFIHGLWPFFEFVIEPFR